MTELSFSLNLIAEIGQVTDPVPQQFLPGGTLVCMHWVAQSPQEKVVGSFQF